jgi:ATP-dependent RNA helicase RhlE
MQSFSELNISLGLKKRLESARFTMPTPIQAAAIPQALEGKDLVATAQTGTGKTLAFMVPVIEKLLQKRATRGITALVLLPTRELAIQVAEQYDALRGELHRAAVVVGGLPEQTQIRAIRSGAPLIVATPGRLQDLLGRGEVCFADLQILVLDEADRMLDMGFLPAIRRIVAVLPRERQTLCFSATMEAAVARLIKDYTRNPERIELGSVLRPSENVRLQAFEVSADTKYAALRHLLIKENGSCLVFARTKRNAERVAKSLISDGVPAATIHGDRSQSQRTAALQGFQRGRFRILVATDLASRGIHVQDIAHVINYDLPDVPEDFIHRVGRTGRAGRHGVASTLFTRDQRSDLFQLERVLGQRIEQIRLTDVSFERERNQPMQARKQPLGATRSTLISLPGELLQAQMAG